MKNALRSGSAPSTKPTTWSRPSVSKASADNATCREGADATDRFVSAANTDEVLPGVNHWTPEVASQEVNFFLLNDIRRNRKQEVTL